MLGCGSSSGKCCRKEDPFQGPRVGSCLTLGNELSEETHVLTKRETLLGMSTQVESRKVREPRKDCSATWLAVSGFMVMGLVSGLSLANHSDSGSFLVAHNRSAKMDSGEDSGRLVGPVHWRLLSPFDLSRILLVGGGLLVQIGRASCRERV